MFCPSCGKQLNDSKVQGFLKWPGLSTQETVFFKVDSSPVFLVFSAALERRA